MALPQCNEMIHFQILPCVLDIAFHATGFGKLPRCIASSFFPFLIDNLCVMCKACAKHFTKLNHYFDLLLGGEAKIPS